MSGSIMVFVGQSDILIKPMCLGMNTFRTAYYKYMEMKKKKPGWFICSLKHNSAY